MFAFLFIAGPGFLSNISSVGKDLTAIANIAREILPNYSNIKHYCVICAGICGLTEKATIDGHRCIRYPDSTREERVQSATTVIHDLTSRFEAHINIATIVPASLHKYFNFHNANVPIPESLQHEQDSLLEDVSSLNDMIVTSNKNFGITTINLCNKFLSKSKKKNRRTNTGSIRRVVKFKDDQLPDGIHFSDSIKEVCFSSIINTAIRDLEYLSTCESSGPSRSFTTHKSLSSSQESLSDSDRDYKRKSSK